MQYSEVQIRVATADVDTAAAIANLVVPYGLYIEDYSDIEELAPKIAHVDLIEQELLDRDRDHAIIHLYISPEENPAEAVSFVRERLESERIGFSIERAQVNEEDWAIAWKKYYFPTKVGERLVVCPSWETYSPVEGEVVLTIDPGMAFGTGTHDTTRLCMQLLEEHVRPGDRLLDVGTGSGILAVSALLLGASAAVGVDIDEVAVRVANENAAANNVSDRVDFFAGDLADKASGRFRVVTANIVADVIIRLIPDLDRFLEPDGVFIASGIIDMREPDVMQALTAAGYRLAGRKESGGWVALAACRAGNSPERRWRRDAQIFYRPGEPGTGADRGGGCASYRACFADEGRGTADRLRRGWPGLSVRDRADQPGTGGTAGRGGCAIGWGAGCLDHPLSGAAQGGQDGNDRPEGG